MLIDAVELLSRGNLPADGYDGRTTCMESFEDLMVRIAELVEKAGGEIRTQPGELIVHVARLAYDADVELSASNREYLRTATAIRMLEEIELLLVERVGWSKAERGNRLVAIRLA